MTEPATPELQAPATAKPPRRSGAALCFLFAAITLLTFLVYRPALRGGFIWDDEYNVTANQLLRTGSGLQRTWLHPHASFQYYPLTYTGFWIEYQLCGLNPWGYHLVNVFLHALNAFLVGLLLSRLGVPGAWLAACLFAVHPLQVESVAWITELKNVLSGFFFLAAFLGFLRFQQGGPRRGGFYALSLLLYLCALASKTSTVALPAALLLVLWWKQESLRRQDLGWLVPFVLVGATMAGVTVWLERHQVGAQSAEWQLSLVQRCLLAGRVVWFAALKFLWPHPLMFVYPRWRLDQTAGWLYLFPLATMAVLLVLWLCRQRTGKGPLAAVLFFVGTTAPVPAAFTLYFMRYSYVADHFYYLAGIAWVGLVGAALWHWLPGLKPRVTVGVLAVAALSALSWQRCQAFRDEETLWRDAVTRNPDAWMAHGNLGVLLAGRGQLAEAISEYKAALRIKPDYAETRYNLGIALLKLGRPTEATEQFTEALRITPDDAATHHGLGNALLQLGRVTDAIGQYEEALRIKPGDAELHNSLGIALSQLGRSREAVAQYEEAVRLSPNYFEAHYNLGNTLFQLDRMPEAVNQYEEALRIEPDHSEARNNLGNALVRLGRLPEAIGQYEETLRRKPDYAPAHQNFGRALAQLSRFSEAVSQYEEALRIDPQMAEAHCNLGNALLQLGKLPEAKTQLEEALKVQPDYAEAHNNLGIVLIRLGEVAEGKAHFEEALRLKPDYAIARSNLVSVQSSPPTHGPKD